MSIMGQYLNVLQAPAVPPLLRYLSRPTERTVHQLPLHPCSSSSVHAPAGTGSTPTRLQVNAGSVRYPTSAQTTRIACRGNFTLTGGKCARAGSSQAGKGACIETTGGAMDRPLTVSCAAGRWWCRSVSMGKMAPLQFQV